MLIPWTPQELHAARPPENITVTDWACRRRELDKRSAITGLYNIDITPFFRPALDRCASPDVDEQSVCAASQIGKTVAFVENVAGYYSDQDPSNIMIVMADKATTEYLSTERLPSMFRDSPALSHLYRPTKFTKEASKLPNGAVITYAWASSVSRLATRNERIVIFDEVDKPGYRAKSEEGDSVSLGKERTKSYDLGEFKHIQVSTPSVEQGNICQAAKTAELCLDWHAKCPHCGQLQPLRFGPRYCWGFKDYKYRAEDGTLHDFGRVVWEGGRDATRHEIRETARYQCGECGELWTTEEKNEAVRNGKEIPRTRPLGDERTFWNHFSRLYSLLDSGRLDTLVFDFVQCFKVHDDRHLKRLQGFINGALAEPFVHVVRKTEESDVKKAIVRELPPETVPQEAVALTCFVDVQMAGFWFEVRAWARDGTSWGVHYGKVPDWSDVEEILFRTTYPVNGTSERMRIWRAAVDTGGGRKETGVSMTEETYQWVIKNGLGRGCRVYPTKGATNPQEGYVRMGRILDKSPSGRPLPRGFQLYHLDTDRLKDALEYRLRQAITGGGNSPFYLHAGTDAMYINQITAEEQRIDPNTGLRTWVKVKEHNHLLDCAVGNIALASREWAGGVAVRRRSTVAQQRRETANSAGDRGAASGGYTPPPWLQR